MWTVMYQLVSVAWCGASCLASTCFHAKVREYGSAYHACRLAAGQQGRAAQEVMTEDVLNCTYKVEYSIA
jgi:hypothetical protein